MKIESLEQLEKVRQSTLDVFNAYFNSNVYQADDEGAKCYYGDVHDATGDDAIYEAFFQYLNAISKREIFADDVGMVAYAADKIAAALESVSEDENKIELYWATLKGLVVNPSVEEAASRDKRGEPRLYIGNGQILVDAGH